ncbi:MAG: apolipoprotein N-acyltransferase [Thermodesulfobacteriota bacterium]
MSKINTSDLILSILSGVLFTISHIVPYTGFLSWILLTPLFIAIEDKRPFHALCLGVLTGTVLNVIGSYWLIETLSRFGGFPFPISLLFLLILSFYSGLSIGIFTLVISILNLLKKRGYLPVIVIASVWTSIEYLFPFLFPYTIANPQAHFLPIIQISDLFGIYAVSFLIIFVNVTLMRVYKFMRKQGPIPHYEITISILLLTLTLIYGFWRIKTEKRIMADSPKIKVGIVQANFNFLEKIEEHQENMIEIHKSMSQSLNYPDLIIWPETAILLWISTSSDQLVKNGNTAIPDIKGTYFVVGGLSYESNETSPDETDYENITKYNTAFLTDSDGNIIGRYHKIKLLLFGEYLPFSSWIPALKKLSPATGDFIPGNELNLFEIKEKGIKIAPLICYEDIIPSFSRKFVKKGANLIINLTNDGWFGESTAPYQHLLLSIPRAVENRRYLIRSTNTGISAIIDPIGRVTDKTDIFQKTNLEGEVGLLEGRETLYTRIGDLFPWACLVFWIGYAFIIVFKKK